jgi:MFS family permease
MTERETGGTDTISTARRWSMLALGVFAPTTGAMFTYGTAFLIPALQRERGLSLSQAGLLVAMPTIGMMLTLIPWGALVDRVGERAVLVIGPGLLCVAGIAAAACAADTPALAAALFVGGIGSASSNGASGRLIVGWFADHRRGLAMGIRQGAQPLAVGLAAIVLPNVANTHGLAAALLVPAVLSGLAALACGIGVLDPARPSAKNAPDLLVNPYRKGSALWRIHAVSVLLVVPQATMWTFALVWLHSARHWPLAAASAVVMAAQWAGVFGRIGSGIWSDRMGSRMRPLRSVAVAACAAMAALAATDYVGWGVAVPIMMIATVISVADNGLSFTAVAEIAGPYWSGRSLGIQNTGQNLASALLPPAFGALITAVGYPATFAVAAALATIAIPLVPADTAETRRERPTLAADAAPVGTR